MSQSQGCLVPPIKRSCSWIKTIILFFQNVQGNPEYNTLSKPVSTWIDNTCSSTFYNILVPILVDDLLNIPQLLKME